MSSFTITFLGTSGGPTDGITCSTLIKSCHKSYEEIISNQLTDELICIDAGSGFTQLSEIIFNEINNTQSNKLLNLYNDSLTPSKYFKIPIVYPFKELNSQASPFKHTKDIFNLIKNYLITHPHLDHILALAINSAGFNNENPKQIYGSNETISALQKFIFNDIIWPNLSACSILNFIRRKFWSNWDLNDSWNVTMFDLSHGKLVKHHENENVIVNENEIKLESVIEINKNEQNTQSIYQTNPKYDKKTNYYNDQELDHYLSSAFLIKHKSLNSSILIFGDFESDLVSNLTKNKKIWTEIAPLIINSNLKCIILECSIIKDETNNDLYGHLIPNHLFNELKILENECSKINSNCDKSPLNGLNIIITHVKEPLNEDSDPRKKLLGYLNDLNEKYKLGINFSIALGGVSIEV